MKIDVPIPSFFRIRNFEKFQHYSDRRPPWIKLYRDLWDDPRFFSLSDADRYLLVGLFVVASQHDNKVSTDQKWLKSQLLTTRRIPLDLFIATGWCESVEQDASMMLAASNALAERYPSRARGETETEVQNTDSSVVLADYPSDFEKFWIVYPRKVGKGAALKAWQKNHRPKLETILASVERDKHSFDWTKDSGQYVPHPATWLNQHRWDDEPSSGPPKFKVGDIVV